jgi:hypothetical protein
MLVVLRQIALLGAVGDKDANAKPILQPGRGHLASALTRTQTIKTLTTFTRR